MLTGRQTDEPEDPFASGCMAVGSTKDGGLSTPIDRERMLDGIDMLEEAGRSF